MTLTVSEIVSSVQGEGKYTGFPTTFIRLFKCNLKCSFCDTTYAQSKGSKRRLSIDTILSYVFKMGNKHICITGGEPLLQENIFVLIYELVDKGYLVTIETNGSVLLESGDNRRMYSYCMDIKCPSSKMDKYNKYENLLELRDTDEVKFVIGDINDYLFAREVLQKYHTKAVKVFSPVMPNKDQTLPAQLAQWLIEDKIPNSKIGVQLHKLINVY